MGDFVGRQFGLVGPLLFPVAVIATAAVGWRGYRRRDAVPVLLTTAAAVPFLYFLWRSATLRINVTWPLVIWPAAFAAAALNLSYVLEHRPAVARREFRWAAGSLTVGIAFVLCAFGYYVFGSRALLGRLDPIGQEAGYERVAAEACRG